jgi:hypothetical protein
MCTLVRLTAKQNQRNDLACFLHDLPLLHMFVPNAFSCVNCKKHVRKTLLSFKREIHVTHKQNKCCEKKTRMGTLRTSHREFSVRFELRSKRICRCTHNSPATARILLSTWTMNSQFMTSNRGKAQELSRSADTSSLVLSRHQRTPVTLH